ncbi:MAG TPA: oxygenase MpaB family protein [Stellaceae bacterium]|nr:oxygenase MpaB family protein [Stellaceae bacterium]
MSDRIVGDAALEDSLAHLRAGVIDPRAGAFGPQSMRWQIDREAALFLGAGRALLLQLAHPWVAAAVAQHSRALHDPIGRFHGTFGTVFAMVFGSLDEAMAAAHRLHRRHTGIVGSIPGGGRYAANDRAALRWVHATLTETAPMAYGLVRTLTAEERARYYAESLRFAAFFGLAPETLAPDWDSFAAYNRAMLESDILTVSDEARAMATRLLTGAGSWIIVPSWYRALTAELLPPRLRVEFGLAYGDAERRAAARARRWLRRLYPLLPARLRFVGPYFEAQERLAGHDRPRLMTRLGNRFWIGRPLLMRPSGAD